MPLPEVPENLRIARPQAGQSLLYVMRAGQTYTFDFAPETATIEHSGSDVRLYFDDGGAVSLKGFFQALNEGDFTLRLPDGVLVSGRDVAEVLNMALEDFHTEGAGLSLDAVSCAAALQAQSPRSLPEAEIDPDILSSGTDQLFCGSQGGRPAPDVSVQDAGYSPESATLWEAEVDVLFRLNLL
ncbi:MAG: hypothetical protein LBB52_04065 [Desulfovibrio sp.]|jgi:hypothetical protein|nr:hypothetical protein [Desulfovibrio sp.]